MNQIKSVQWIAFAESECVASGQPQSVVTEIKAFTEVNPERAVLVLDAETSYPIEIDLRGDLAAVLERLPVTPKPEALPNIEPQTPVARQPGRPKIGVIAREVTLLPRHWEWLAKQSGGASVALRKLVEEAMRTSAVADRKREMQESTYRFMTAVAGNEPGYEEATRALFAGDVKRFAEQVSGWSLDVQAQLFRLAGKMAE